MNELKPGAPIEVRVYRDVWAPALVVRVQPGEAIDARDDEGSDWSLDAADEGVNWRLAGARRAVGLVTPEWRRVRVAARNVLVAWPHSFTGGGYRRSFEAMEELAIALLELGPEEPHADA